MHEGQMKNYVLAFEVELKKAWNFWDVIFASFFARGLYVKYWPGNKVMKELERQNEP